MNKIEAKQNLEMLEADRIRLLSLNHLNSTHAFRTACEKRIKQLNENIRNIRANLG